MKIKIFLLISMCWMILLTVNVFGFAVTNHYWDENPLYIQPGETKEVRAFGLQNMVGNEDITLEIKQTSAFDIAEVIDEAENYEVPFGRKDVYVNMRVTVPQDIAPGTKYDVGASFKQINLAEGGNVQFTTGMVSSIVVLVSGEQREIPKIEEETSELPAEKKVPSQELTGKKVISNLNLLGPILILILIAIGIFYRHELKKSSQNRKRRV